MFVESLPLPILSNVLMWLPADERPRAALVCRRFRDALQDGGVVWSSVDFSQSKASRLSDRLLQRVAAKAGAHLTRLNLGEWVTMRQLDGQAVVFSTDVVLGVVRSASSLRSLTVFTSVGVECPLALVRRLVAAAPQLVALETDVHAPTAEEACAFLRNDAPFGAVRLRRLRASFYGGAGGVQFATDGLKAVTAQLVSRHHVFLRELAVESHSFAVPGAFNALVDALVPRRMAGLSFTGCLPAARDIVRLLLGCSLSRLVIKNTRYVLFQTNDSALSLAAALRVCCTLTSLTLSAVGLWRSPSRFSTLVASLVGHPSIRALDLGGNHVDKHSDIVGTQLARLIAANAPALTTLLLSGRNLGDAGLFPLFRALPGNTFLRELDCSNDYGADISCVARRMLDAVRANSALMALRLGNSSYKELYPAYSASAEAVVTARAAAAAAAQ